MYYSYFINVQQQLRFQRRYVATNSITTRDCMIDNHELAGLAENKENL